MNHGCLLGPGFGFDFGLGFVVVLVLFHRNPSSFRRSVGFAVVNFDIVDWPWLKVKASLKVQELVVAD